MKDRNRNFIVGLTTIFGLLGLMYLILIFGELPAWLGNQTYPVYVDMDAAWGLTAGSRVRLNGIDIGSVEEMRLKDNPAEGVMVVTQIRQGYDVPASSHAEIAAGLLGGGAALNFIVPPVAEDEPVAYLPKDGTAHIPGSTVTLTDQLESVLGENLEQFGAMSERIALLADEYLKVGQRLNELLEPQDIADVRAGQVTPNLSTVVVQINSRLAEMETTVQAINDLVADPRLHEDILATASNARQLTETAQERLDQLSRQFVAVVDDLGDTLAGVNVLLADVREGQGSLGRLIQDPSLYNNFEDAAGRMGAALREFQLLLEKWQTEGVPIQF